MSLSTTSTIGAGTAEDAYTAFDSPTSVATDFGQPQTIITLPEPPKKTRLGRLSLWVREKMVVVKPAVIGGVNSACEYLETVDVEKETTRLVSFVRNWRHEVRNRAGFVLDATASNPVLCPDLVRPSFRETPIPQKHFVDETHSHPSSANERSNATSFMNLVARSLGREVFFYQQGAADQRNRFSGDRTYYFAKDAALRPVANTSDNLSEKFVGIVDVDYYVDMNEKLATWFAPVMLYTFEPTRAAKSDGEYNYTWLLNGKVRYTVAGGATYEHHVWNYSSDALKIVSRVSVPGTPYSLPVGVTTYLVDRRAMGEDHSIVLLMPTRRWGLLWAWLANLMLEGKELSRFAPVQGEYVRLQVHDGKQTLTSTGRVNMYCCATLPAAQDDGLVLLARNSKQQIALATVKSHLENDEQGAAVLRDFLLNGLENQQVAPAVAPVKTSVHGYQMTTTAYDPDAKPSLVSYMDPLLDGAFAPDMSLSNEQAAVNGRVVNISHKEPLEMTPFLVNCIAEFSELLVPKANMAHPAGYEIVEERQDSPTQRKILEQAAQSGKTFGRYVKSFIKKEAYEEPKEPRIISQIVPQDKAEYSRYTYALQDHLKEQRWYAFGLAPAEVADRVATICRQAREVDEGDLSRCDGRISNVVRLLETHIVSRFFHQDHLSDALQLLKTQHHLKAYCTLGTEYKTLWTRLSGSPETSIFNTILSAFISYVAFRMDRLSPKEAYQRLGIYGGDDSLTADVTPGKLANAAKMVGQVLTSNVRKRGQTVTFLSRVFGPGVWFGEPNSCCTIPRQLSKFHTTVALPPGITAQQKLIEKARCYWLTDRNTPIIGKFAQKVVVLAKIQPADAPTDPALAALTTWWAGTLDLDLQFPNTEDDWMWDYLASVLPEFDCHRFQDWLDGATSLDYLLKPPSFHAAIEPKISIPCVIDGDIKKPVVGGNKKGKNAKKKEKRDSEKKAKEPEKPKARSAPAPKSKGAAVKPKGSQ